MDEYQKATLTVEAWKKTIDVQQHFNEICMKIRNVYATLLAGLFALTGVMGARTENIKISTLGYDISGVSLILLVTFCTSMLFYFIDRHWYHRLLVGAVFNGMELEAELKKNLSGFNLTSKIGDNSALDISKHTVGNWMLFILAKALCAEVTRREGKALLRSDAKLAIFYKSVAYFSFLAFAISAASGGL